MYNLNINVYVPMSPFKKEGVDVKLLETVESYIKHRYGHQYVTLSHLQYRELPIKDGKRVFKIIRAFDRRDR